MLCFTMMKKNMEHNTQVHNIAQPFCVCQKNGMLAILKNQETQSISVQAVAQNIVAVNTLPCVLPSHCSNEEGSHQRARPRCLTPTLKHNHRGFQLEAPSLTGKPQSVGKCANIIGPWQLQMSPVGEVKYDECCLRRKCVIEIKSMLHAAGGKWTSP